METYEKHWAALKLSKGTWAISNEPSITTKWDHSDANLVSYAVKKGWWPADRANEFNAALAYVDFHTAAQLSRNRAMRYRQLLSEKAGSVDLEWFKRILRDHYGEWLLAYDLEAVRGLQQEIVRFGQPLFP